MYLKPNDQVADTDDTPGSELPHSRLSNSGILNNFDHPMSHLTPDLGEALGNLLNKFPRVTQDTPSRCTVVQHNIRIKPGALPIK